MKIALVIDHFHPGKGGAERSLGEILSGLHARGHDLQLVAMSWENQIPVWLETHRVAADPFPRWRKDLSFAANSSAVLKTLAPDLVLGVRHTCDLDIFLARGGLYCETLKANAEAKQSVFRGFLRSFSPKHRVLLSLEEKLFRKADPPLVIAPSNLIGRHCVDNFQLAPHRVLVVPNGVDLQKFHPPNLEQRSRLRSALGLGNELVFLFAAHNFRLKGLNCLLEAWKSLDREKVRLLVVGRDRPPKAAIPFSNVQFLGEHPNPVELYQTADVLVHPTFYDTFGRVIIEALACGLPVITTQLAGASELLTDGVHGFVLKHPRQIAEMVMRMKQLENPTFRRQLSANARALAEQYPQADYVKKTVDAIEMEGARKNL